MSKFEAVRLAPVSQWIDQDDPRGWGLHNPVDGAPLGQPPAFLQTGELGEGLQAARELLPHIRDAGFWLPRTETPTEHQDLGDDKIFEGFADRFNVLGYAVDGTNPIKELEMAILMSQTPEHHWQYMSQDPAFASNPHHARLMRQSARMVNNGGANFSFGIGCKDGQPKGIAEYTVMAIHMAVETMQRDPNADIDIVDAAGAVARDTTDWYQAAQIGTNLKNLTGDLQNNMGPGVHIDSMLLVPDLGGMGLRHKLQSRGLSEQASRPELTAVADNVPNQAFREATAYEVWMRLGYIPTEHLNY